MGPVVGLRTMGSVVGLRAKVPTGAGRGDSARTVHHRALHRDHIHHIHVGIGEIVSLELLQDHDRERPSEADGHKRAI